MFGLGVVQAHFRNKAAGFVFHAVAPFFTALRPAHQQAALGAGDAHIHQAAFFFQLRGGGFARIAMGVIGIVLGALRQFCGFAVAVEGQHAFGYASQNHMRPFQPFGGVQGREREFIAMAFALAQGGEQGYRLHHFKKRFGGRGQIVVFFVIGLAATAFGHPGDEFQHIFPALGGLLFVLGAFVQMLFVVDVFEPLLQKRQRILFAYGLPRLVLQLVHKTAKLVQVFQGAVAQAGAQQGGK